MQGEKISAAIVARLVAAQFPQWADLPVVPVQPGGWDNRTFRLGDTMSVRLPSAAGYVASVGKEQAWLPRLAPHLPLPIPTPLALGGPSEECPWPWSVRRWIDGQPASRTQIRDRNGFAEDLAGFLVALQTIDPTGGPAAGAHSFYRGGPLIVYDGETHAAIAALGTRIDTVAATRLWDNALAATWTGAPVWFHGDVAAGNLLVDDDGQLAAVIDFGTCGVGDPACDLVIAWTMFEGQSRGLLRTILAVDDAMWARAQGWALWKSLITLAAPHAGSSDVAHAENTTHELLAGYR